MSDLLSLPNEILCRIMHSVDLGDLDCFSESCPLFKALAKDALELHHKRQRKYAHITIQGCQDHKGRHRLYLLGQVCMDPRVAWYVHFGVTPFHLPHSLFCHWGETPNLCLFSRVSIPRRATEIWGTLHVSGAGLSFTSVKCPVSWGESQSSTVK